MRDWPPGCMDGPDWIDPRVLDDEVERLLVNLDLAPSPYLGRADVLAKLRELGLLRRAHRRARRAITELWFGAAWSVAMWWFVGPWVWIPLASVFTLLAVHRMTRPGVSRERGRELDADIADARARLDAVGER